MTLLASFLAIVLLVAAQTTVVPSGEGQAERTGGRLEGTVLNSITGEPVPRADVRLQLNANANVPGSGTYSHSSDAQGKFVFDNVVPGTYGLVARKAGFVLSPYRERQTTHPRPGTLLNIGKGQILAKLDIKLVPQGVIAGRLINKDGEPLAKAQVAWFQITYVQGRKQLQRQGSTQSNDQGEYRCAELPPGEYFLGALVPQPSIRVGDPVGTKILQERDVNTFYPGVIDPLFAVSIEVKAGVELRGIDIPVRSAPVYSIRGRVAGGGFCR